ncbi:hypothetical protein A5320_01055 [Rheinheimera sp. SA_1]|uniref:YkoP family protein n=1 Tax=Rheinheimera sp. SA_1 TaxID=1827365 RepID=UPI000800E46B|nr:hypothetical protein [Rheinheimera sp. SA_1]OBP16049.1 hypothetical protein A5320_01055 [Rheinheimera sp. SA_1]
MDKSSWFYQVMCWYDGYWRRRNGVEKFDELLSFSFEQYAGERRLMNDQSWVEPGDWLAILHFNRECFVSISANPKDKLRNALRFRKQLLLSFSHLAKDLTASEKFGRVKAFHGVSWIPPHGEKLGFLIERLPDSPLSRLRKIYFSILIKTFFPHLVAAEKNRIQPHAYWLTRQSLLNNFAAEAQDEYQLQQS